MPIELTKQVIPFYRNKRASFVGQHTGYDKARSENNTLQLFINVNG